MSEALVWLVPIPLACAASALLLWLLRRMERRAVARVMRDYLDAIEREESPSGKRRPDEAPEGDSGEPR